MGAVGSIIVRFLGDTENLNKNIKEVEGQLKSTASRMTSIGNGINKAFTVPFGLALTAGVKLFAQVQENFSNIENLVGITGDRLEEFKDGVKSLSGEVGKSQSELSRALFTVTSAGIRGASALVVLEQAAKGSVIGLGDTQEVARALTGVMQAYGEETLSASRAADIFAGIVKEGNLEAAKLTPILGRITGVASQLGVSLEEVGAQVATFSRLGINVEEAVTGVRGILNSLLKGSDQGQKALDALQDKFKGTAIEGVKSFSDLRKAVADPSIGLTKTLLVLAEATKDNDELLSDLFPNIRGLAAVMGTAGAQGETLSAILKSLSTSTGLVNDGFERAKQTVQQRFNRAIVNLKNSAIELGEVLVPVITEVLDKVTAAAREFNSWSDGTKELIVRMGGLVSILGLAFTITGKLGFAIAASVRQTRLLRAATDKASKSLLLFRTATAGFVGAAALVVVLTAAAIAYKKVSDTARDGARAQNAFLDVQNAVKKVVGDTTGVIDEQATAIGIAKDRVRELTAELKPLQEERQKKFEAGTGTILFDLMNKDRMDELEKQINEYKKLAQTFTSIEQFIFDNLDKGTTSGDLITERLLGDGLNKLGGLIDKVNNFPSSPSISADEQKKLDEEEKIRKDKIADIYAKLNEEVRLANELFKLHGDEAERNIAIAAAHEKAIESLIRNGYTAQGAAVQSLIKDTLAATRGDDNITVPAEIDASFDFNMALRTVEEVLDRVEREFKSSPLDVEVGLSLPPTTAQIGQTLRTELTRLESIVDTSGGAFDSTKGKIEAYSKALQAAAEHTGVTSSFTDALKSQLENLGLTAEQIAEVIANIGGGSSADFSLLENFLKELGLEGDVKDTAEAIASMASALNSTWQQFHDNQMSRLEEWKNAQKKWIEESVLNEEEKAEKLKELEEDYQKKKLEIERKAVKRKKALATFEAITNTAVAITKVSANPALVALVAAIGAIQLATIASTPLPALAEGGLAFGPTAALVGDNPNASVDPEVIAPLSKLKDMLGSAGGNLHVTFAEPRLEGDALLFAIENMEIIRGRQRGYN